MRANIQMHTMKDDNNIASSFFILVTEVNNCSLAQSFQEGSQPTPRPSTYTRTCPCHSEQWKHKRQSQEMQAPTLMHTLHYKRCLNVRQICQQILRRSVCCANLHQIQSNHSLPLLPRYIELHHHTLLPSLDVLQMAANKHNCTQDTASIFPPSSYQQTRLTKILCTVFCLQSSTLAYNVDRSTNMQVDVTSSAFPFLNPKGPLPAPPPHPHFSHVVCCKGILFNGVVSEQHFDRNRKDYILTICCQECVNKKGICILACL